MSIRRIGVLAETHGAVPPDVTAAFASSSVDLILHAGDIGGEHVVEQLARIAPVVAVAGSSDEPLYHRFPWDLRLSLAERRILICHWYDNYGRIHPGYRALAAVWRPHVLVYGHAGEARADREGDTLFLSPGCAGPTDAVRHRSIAVLDVSSLEARIHPL
jgi:hypothetical protein